MGSVLAFSFAAIDDAHVLGMRRRSVVEGRGKVPDKRLAMESGPGGCAFQ
jgi:hypothetical protein